MAEKKVQKEALTIEALQSKLADLISTATSLSPER